MHSYASAMLVVGLLMLGNGLSPKDQSIVGLGCVGFAALFALLAALQSKEPSNE